MPRMTNIETEYESLFRGLMMIIDAVAKLNLGTAILMVHLVQIARSYLCGSIELHKIFAKEVASLNRELDNLRVGFRSMDVWSVEGQELRGVATSLLEQDSHHHHQQQSTFKSRMLPSCATLDHSKTTPPSLLLRTSEK